MKTNKYDDKNVNNDDAKNNYTSNNQERERD